MTVTRCNERFVCGALDTEFERCLQAIDCQMSREMKDGTAPDSTDPVAVFMQQMIPHHVNAIQMSKLILKQVSPPAITAALDDDGMTDVLIGIISVQNYHIHKFRNYLGSRDMLHEETHVEQADPQVSASIINAFSLTTILTALLLTW